MNRITRAGHALIPLDEKLQMAQLLLHTIQRRLQFLFSNTSLRFSERLKIACRPRAGLAAMQYLLKHCLTEDSKDPHFDVAGYRIHFKPTYSIEDRRLMLQGVAQVLIESFYFPDLFNSSVCIAAGDVVLDLGANIGTTALVFSKAAGVTGEVYAFEPLFHELCAANIEANGADNVKVIPLAVSDHCGTSEFERTDFCITSRLHQEKHTNETASPLDCVEVGVISIDRWVEEQALKRVDFMKLDIEGAEEQALLGARETILRFRPRLSISSYHTDFTGELQHSKLVAILKEWGYQIEEVGTQHIFAA